MDGVNKVICRWQWIFFSQRDLFSLCPEQPEDLTRFNLKEFLLNYRILDERIAWPRATVEVAIDMNYRAQ